MHNYLKFFLLQFCKQPCKNNVYYMASFQHTSSGIQLFGLKKKKERSINCEIDSTGLCNLKSFDLRPCFKIGHVLICSNSDIQFALYHHDLVLCHFTRKITSLLSSTTQHHKQNCKKCQRHCICNHLKNVSIFKNK